jgi:hypothetical protein
MVPLQLVTWLGEKPQSNPMHVLVSEPICHAYIACAYVLVWQFNRAVSCYLCLQCIHLYCTIVVPKLCRFPTDALWHQNHAPPWHASFTDAARQVRGMGVVMVVYRTACSQHGRLPAQRAPTPEAC